MTALEMQMNPDEMFLPITYAKQLKDNIIKILIDHIDNKKEWISLYSFKAIEIDKEVILSDPFFNKLNKKRVFRGGIMNLGPNSCYNWHKDTDRKGAINMLLHHDGNSKCLFTKDDQLVNSPIVELKYNDNTLYAFNTQAPHMVLNFTGERYLFSIEFLDKDSNLSYEELLQDIKEIYQ